MDSANKITNRENLKSPDGTTVTVVSGTTPADHDGWMWDLTVPGNNDHDFYVVTVGNGWDVGLAGVQGLLCGGMDGQENWNC
jgi:hypothetical protein